MKVKVNEGWQLAHEDGTPAQPGDIVEVAKAIGEQWIAGGMASKVAAKAPSKAVTSSKNKAVTESKNKADE